MKPPQPSLFLSQWGSEEEQAKTQPGGSYYTSEVDAMDVMDRVDEVQSIAVATAPNAMNKSSPPRAAVPHELFNQ